MTSDEQLLEEYVRGDQRAFGVLVERYQSELFAFLYRFVSDSAAAEDLFQETFVQVHKNVKSFDSSRRFRPWLFTIAANKARDYLRSVGRHEVHSYDRVAGADGETSFLELMEAVGDPPEVELGRGEDVERVQRVLAGLPGIYREVLVMAYFHDFSYREIAEMLGVPLGTVKSRLHGAMGIFAKAYKDGGE